MISKTNSCIVQPTNKMAIHLNMKSIVQPL